MTKTARRTVSAPVPRPAAQSGPRRWLLLAHQLPATPSKLRVKTWRRLQDLGAVAVKQALYVLPDTPECREDFEWLRVEIEDEGGEATIFAANHLSTEAEAVLVEEFRRNSQTMYAQLASELQKADRRQPREVSRFRERYEAMERVDFFGSAGRDRVASLLAALEPKPDAPAEHGAGKTSRDDFQRKYWVTRPRPGVDRMSSAWLIRRFIDPAATFGFVTDSKHAGENAVPFDMYGTGFGHAGDRCTFETLAATFGIADKAVLRLAEVVHDLDLKDGKFGAPEAVTLGAAIDGLQMSCADDHQLLEHGMILFEAMYRSFSQRGRPARPRPVAKPARRQRRS